VIVTHHYADLLTRHAASFAQSATSRAR
jgi:hypothetical protein